MSTHSLSGYIYYVLFIDDFSRKAWIYFMKSKSETFSKFEEYKSLVENQPSKNIRDLRYDNGGEFESSSFNNLCGDVSIYIQLSIPYNPWQHGVEKSLSRSNTRSKGILYLVHLDVCGPMSTHSLSGYIYYVLFIDDLSIKDWIYFMKAKSETFSKFQEYKSLVENNTSRKIHPLRSDNEGEFDSNSIINFCIDARIRRQLKIPYNHQQNGVA